jgi:hypothetical protein
LTDRDVAWFEGFLSPRGLLQWLVNEMDCTRAQAIDKLARKRLDYGKDGELGYVEVIRNSSLTQVRWMPRMWQRSTMKALSLEQLLYALKHYSSCNAVPYWRDVRDCRWADAAPDFDTGLKILTGQR